MSLILSWQSLVGVALIFIGVPYANSALSGWQTLAGIYRAQKRKKPQLGFVSGRMGPIAYPWSLGIRFDSKFLRLTMTAAFRLGHRPLRIPWSDIAISEGTIGMRPGLRFDFLRTPGVHLIISRSAADELERISGHELEPHAS